MSTRANRFLAILALLIIAAAPRAHAAARTVFGPSWIGPAGRLQSIVDAAYGPGRINVQTDYLGAGPGEPDIIVWSSTLWPVLQVREIAGHAHRAHLGWYLETGDARPVMIDGAGDGPVFKNDASPSTAVLHFRPHDRNIGFYLRTSDAGSGLGERILFTNRTFNDVGPGGTGALHEPMEGGDIQALVFDLSPWGRPFTWLVCFEDRDSGAMPGPCCAGTDNDYADYVFEVRAHAVTANLAPTFGALKQLYRD